MTHKHQAPATNRKQIDLDRGPAAIAIRAPTVSALVALTMALSLALLKAAKSIVALIA